MYSYIRVPHGVGRVYRRVFLISASICPKISDIVFFNKEYTTLHLFRMYCLLCIV